MIIGSHVSMKGKEMLLGSAQEAAGYHADTMMVYTGAPQNTRRKAISEMNIPAGQAYMAAHNIQSVVVHAPYIINLGNTVKPQNYGFAVEFMRQEVARADALGATQMAFHPGAHLGKGAAVAIKQISKGLNEIITKDQKVHIAIETMAGKGTEVGRTFEEIAAIIDGVTESEKISVTFDTCHTNDAGYDIRSDFDGVLNEFDHIIGLDKLQLLHLNDSKNPQGSHKDRHANIGFGTIGFEALSYVAHHPQLQDRPMILETPYVGPDKKHQWPPYGFEIAMLRQNEFDPDLLTKIQAQ
ncbi:deoxyribonuclease IV [Agrilactobacillus fermenti]|uniref:deoxyribonuclease IV n=1 Tax=Agrilactobacillus fermenti TaxID=2586909 RepID=UPI001E442559|nr:deoxyribonuclease IV [Agrilactobacillus fermenti]MCD2255807.1 deoxyribonuclease IV [Agrilactobacillus fermenti]